MVQVYICMSSVTYVLQARRDWGPGGPSGEKIFDFLFKTAHFGAPYIFERRRGVTYLLSHPLNRPDVLWLNSTSYSKTVSRSK